MPSARRSILETRHVRAGHRHDRRRALRSGSGTVDRRHVDGVVPRGIARGSPRPRSRGPDATLSALDERGLSLVQRQVLRRRQRDQQPAASIPADRRAARSPGRRGLGGQRLPDATGARVDPLVARGPRGGRLCRSLESPHASRRTSRGRLQAARGDDGRPHPRRVVGGRQRPGLLDAGAAPSGGGGGGPRQLAWQGAAGDQGHRLLRRGVGGRDLGGGGWRRFQDGDPAR